MNIAELEAMLPNLRAEKVRIRAHHVLKGPGYLELEPASQWSFVGLASFDPDSTPREVFIANLILKHSPMEDWYELQTSSGNPQDIADRLKLIVAIDPADGWDDDPMDLLFCPECGTERRT